MGDAGTVTRSFAPASRDVVIRDVFAVDKTPAELTGVDFVRTVDNSLAPGGLYILNCGDDRALNAARAEATALLEVFEYVSIVADSAMLKGRRRGNIILAGSHVPLPQLGSAEAASISRVLMGGGVPANIGILRRFGPSPGRVHKSHLSNPDTCYMPDREYGIYWQKFLFILVNTLYSYIGIYFMCPKSTYPSCGK